MAQSKSDALRAHVKELLSLAEDMPDPELKRQLNSRAFSLAQHVEAVERADGDGQEPPPDPNFKVVAESNIKRFIDELYVEQDGKMRELYRSLAAHEERWYGIKQERLDMLIRLLRQCDGKASHLSGLLKEQRAYGVTIDGAERLLENVLDTQRFLRISLRQELVREDGPF